MLNELLAHPWALWIIMAALAGVIEILAPSFTFIFAALASLVAAAASLRFEWIGQAVTFAVALTVFLGLLRPRFLEKFHTPRKLGSRAEVLLGREGVVTEAIDPQGKIGRVSVGGQDWAAQSAAAIETGKKIVVEGSDGIVLKVKEA